MSPTFFGLSHVADCPQCDLRWHVEPIDNVETGAVNMMCFHCGQVIEMSRHSGDRAVGDIVRVKPLEPDDCVERGSLVAVRWNDHTNIKRVGAAPGDIIHVDGQHRLLVNGRRMEDLLFVSAIEHRLPRFLVDDDQRRKDSRWRSPPYSWHRTSERTWRWDDTDSSPWLIYSHLRVHDRNRPSPVQDDHPYNTSISRRLNSVDRFLLTGTVSTPATELRLEIAFWSAAGAVAIGQPIRSKRFSASFYDATSTDGIPVSESQPVAIRAIGGPATLSELKIERLVEYRLRPTDDRQSFPLTLGDGQYFVVGDNVPISEDSRSVGSVDHEQLVGTVAAQHY